MKNKIRVIIADDHDIYLEGLEKNLNGDEGIEVVAAALNGKKLVDLVKQYQPDVVVTDIRMPVMDGVEAILTIQKISKDIHILVLSTFDNNYLVIDALDAGAIGYILKDAPKAEVIEAVKTVSENTPYYCSRTSTSLARLIKKSILAAMKVKTSIGIAIFAVKNKLYPVPEALMSR